MRTITMFLLLMFLTVGTVGAEVAPGDPRRLLAEEILKAMKIKERMDQQLAEMETYQKKYMGDMPEDNRNPQAKAEYEQAMQQVRDYMNWDKIKEDYITAIAESFSQAELEAALAYVQSPAGASVIDKFPDFVKKLGTIMMKRMKTHYPRSFSSPAGSEVKGMLRTFATASETYAVTNKGKYPADMSALTSANPPYMIKNYCGAEEFGYRFECDMSDTGYTFTAAPVGEGSDARPAMTMTTGGVLTEGETEAMKN